MEAAEYDIKRIQKYLKHLAEIADEVFQAEEDAKAGGSSVSEAPEGPQRKLQQQDLIPSYLGTYATAFRFIFTNIFDFFRDFGESLPASPAEPQKGIPYHPLAAAL